jgi:hypothetical protein
MKNKETKIKEKSREIGFKAGHVDPFAHMSTSFGFYSLI